MTDLAVAEIGKGRLKRFDVTQSQSFTVILALYRYSMVDSGPTLAIVAGTWDNSAFWSINPLSHCLAKTPRVSTWIS